MSMASKAGWQASPRPAEERGGRVSVHGRPRRRGQHERSPAGAGRGCTGPQEVVQHAPSRMYSELDSRPPGSGAAAAWGRPSGCS